MSSRSTIKIYEKTDEARMGIRHLQRVEAPGDPLIPTIILLYAMAKPDFFFQHSLLFGPHTFSSVAGVLGSLWNKSPHLCSHRPCKTPPQQLSPRLTAIPPSCFFLCSETGNSLSELDPVNTEDGREV